MIDWLTGLNLLLALVNLLFVYLLLRETVKLREVETEPELSIYIQQNQTISGVYDIIVKNIGKGPAYNLTFHFDTESELIKVQNFRKLHELGFFQGVDYLAPNQEYGTLFGGQEMMKQPPIKPLKIQVNYTNKKSKKKYSDSFIIDPSNYWGTSYFGTKTLSDISRDLDKISSEVHRVSEQLKKSRSDSQANRVSAEE